MAVVAHAISLEYTALMMDWFKDGSNGELISCSRSRDNQCVPVTPTVAAPLPPRAKYTSPSCQLGEGKKRSVDSSLSSSPRFCRSSSRSSTPDGGPLSPRGSFTSRGSVWAKKTRAWANAYELSQDLHDKQLEMLERKYGGPERARWAARIIQQAYRQYCVNRSFRRLRQESEERGLSRRLCNFTRSNTIWTDMVSSIDRDSLAGMKSTVAVGGCRCCADRRSECCSRAWDFPDPVCVGMEPPTRVEFSTPTSSKTMVKSHSLNLCSRNDNSASCVGGSKQQHGVHKTRSRELLTIEEHTASNPALMVAVLHSDADDGSSSTEFSPQDKVERNGCAAVDLPSVAFQTLLDSKETEVLNDSFNSDSSHDGTCQNSKTRQQVHCTACNSKDCNAVPWDTSFDKGTRVSYENLMPIESHMFNSDCSECCRELGLLPTACSSPNTCSSNSLPAGETRVYYCNTEVRLRKKKLAQEKQQQLSSSPATATPLSMSLSDQSSSVCDSTLVEQHVPADGSTSPIWKRKSAFASSAGDGNRISRLSETSDSSGSRRDLRGGFLTSETSDSSESRRDIRSGMCISSSTSSDTASMNSDHIASYYNRSSTAPLHVGSAMCVRVSQEPVSARKGVSEKQRKRTYRIGLNLFNKKPERGIRHLMEQGFVGEHPADVAHFLLTRKGLSRQMIGDYLGNLQKPFNMDVLRFFSQEVDLAGLEIDVALRKFQTYFRMPGEAQKIEQLMQAFAHRYADCNPEQVKNFHSLDVIFLLAYAIIMLNTDLHSRSMKPDKRMKPEDFVKNLRRVDNGHDIDRDLLLGIYERMKANEFHPGSDHVSQVLKVEQMTVGLKMPLALPHRRLVCYCRLFEVRDLSKKEKPTAHQREVFLFNDMLLVSKVYSKKKNSVTYSYRQQFSVCGMQVYLFETSCYKYGIRLTTNVDGKVLITVNARNENDRIRFVEDLKEIILEVNEMEAIRIEDELQRQQYTPTHFAAVNRLSKDSGVVGDLDLYRPGAGDPLVNRLSAPEYAGPKKNTLTGSLVDLADGGFQRTSGGSMDSGMASTCSASDEQQSSCKIVTKGIAVKPTKFTMVSTPTVAKKH